jgi:hypothetical protein
MVRQHAGRSLTLPRGTAQPTVAGTGGDFTVDLKALAQNATGNNQLSAANGYRPGLNLPPAATFGPGMPDPNAPGLVVTLSTTRRRPAARTPTWPASSRSTR